MNVTDATHAAAFVGPTDWFTGRVWIEIVSEEPEPSRLRASKVTFSPGARTAWHAHPCGQTLLIVDGVARVQTRGKPVREIGPGGVVYIQPGEWHWHGATSGRPMTHLALQDTAPDGSEPVWGEQVSDVEYRGAAR